MKYQLFVVLFLGIPIGLFSEDMPEKHKETIADESRPDIDEKKLDVLCGETHSIGKIREHMSGDDLVSLLGAPGKKGRPGRAEAYGGELLQVWYFPRHGVVATMEKVGRSKWRIWSVAIRSPCRYRTARGIGIGSEGKLVMMAYGTLVAYHYASGQDEAVIVGDEYHCNIRFSLHADRVTQIEMWVTAP